MTSKSASNTNIPSTSARYVRWQGLAMAQLTLAVALISGLSVAGLGAGFTLLRENPFPVTGGWRLAFAGSQVCFTFAALVGCAAVITRLLDFRLTARTVRKEEKPDYKRPLTIFGNDAETYGLWTWRFFWSSCFLLLLGVLLLAGSLVNAYWCKIV